MTRASKEILMNLRLKLPSLALALCILATLSPAGGQAKDPFLGDWKGTLDVAGAQLEIALHFSLDDKKELTGTMDSISQGAMGLPLAVIKFEGRSATFQIAGIPGEPTFKGTLDETGLKLAGSFSQGGYDGTFQTQKVEK
jgi:hypothetical protein